MKMSARCRSTAQGFSCTRPTYQRYCFWPHGPKQFARPQRIHRGNRHRRRKGGAPGAFFDTVLFGPTRVATAAVAGTAVFPGTTFWSFTRVPFGVKNQSWQFRHRKLPRACRRSGRPLGQLCYARDMTAQGVRCLGIARMCTENRKRKELRAGAAYVRSVGVKRGARQDFACAVAATFVVLEAWTGARGSHKQKSLVH